MSNKYHINHWYERAKVEDDYTNKFISLWISFNAFYNSYGDDNDKEFKRIENSCEKLKDDFLELPNLPGSCFKCFQQYILDKPDNPGSIQGKFRKVYYSDVSCLSEYLRVLYQIRCNLFHGNKINDNEQDKKLIELAYRTLFQFLTCLYKKEKHITGWED
ncbi:MAG: hypothetical protein K2X04_02135 [Burkholderiales bacterium]|nr:hypothetical protein [Burkholderiales bacterium]